MAGNINPQWWDEALVRMAAIVGARSCQAVTPSDTADLNPAPCRAVYSGDGGTVTILFADDQPGSQQPVVFAPGEVKSIHARRIYNTGTTSAKVQAWY